MKLTLIEGMGLGEQNHFQNELSLYDFTAKVYDFDQAFSASFKTEIDGSVLVVLRSRWSATVEENLFVKALVKKYQPYFEVLSELLAAEKIKLVAMGRGALLWLEWLAITQKMGAPLVFYPQDFATSTWVDTKIRTLSNTLVSIRSSVSGHASLQTPDFGALAARPWIENGENTVGWVVENRTYLSLLDVFSLSERAQLPDYGYEDLSAISTRSNVIQMLVSGEM